MFAFASHPQPSGPERECPALPRLMFRGLHATATILETGESCPSGMFQEHFISGSVEQEFIEYMNSVSQRLKGACLELEGVSCPGGRVHKADDGADIRGEVGAGGCAPGAGGKDGLQHLRE